MLRGMMASVLVGGLGLFWSIGSRAADAVVQDFGGWKITIQPGKSYVVDHQVVPIAYANQTRDQNTNIIIQPGPPGPEPVPPPTAAAAPPTPLPPPDGQIPSSPPAPADELPIITPGESSECCDGQTKVMPPEGTVDPRYLPQMYSEVYKTIPFIRAEYDANPSYIHDTTVEFLFGKMRPTVVARGAGAYNNCCYNNPYSYVTPYYGWPAGYGTYGFGYGGYAYPAIQLIVPGTGLRIHHLN